MTSRNFTAACFASGLLATALGAAASAQDAEGPVYLLVPNSTTIRWAKFDEPNIREAFAKYAPGVELRVLNANGKAAQQVSDVDAALASGAIGIILVAVDPSQAGGTIAKAAQDGVPVVTYAHDPGPGPVSYHVSVPFTDIGTAQAEFLAEHLPDERPVKLALMLGDPNFKFYHDQMQGFEAVIDPLVASGDVEIVCRSDAMGYLPANAQKNMEQCLTQTNNEVDAAVVMNDDTGGGVIAALSAQGLQGEVKLFGGYDATLEAVQRVLAGWQGATMSPPYEGMADAAAQLVLAAVSKTEPPAGLINGTWDNGFTEGGVPARLEPNIFITADTVQETVIDAGLYTREEVCAGIAADSAFCASN
jgi:D-xylose transport system substrate-binding protein